MEKKIVQFPQSSGNKQLGDTDGATFIMEDLETGEREECDDLATALFGPGVKKDEYAFEEIKGKE